jgi:hypothetical protein
MLTHSHNILKRWKNFVCQLLNVHGIKDIRHIEMNTAEALLPEPSSSEVEIAINKLK